MFLQLQDVLPCLLIFLILYHLPVVVCLFNKLCLAFSSIIPAPFYYNSGSAGCLLWPIRPDRRGLYDHLPIHKHSGCHTKVQIFWCCFKTIQVLPA